MYLKIWSFAFFVFIIGMMIAESSQSDYSELECVPKLKIVVDKLVISAKTHNRNDFRALCARYQRLVTDCEFTESEKLAVQESYWKACESSTIMKWLSSSDICLQGGLISTAIAVLLILYQLN